jgi:hypothetical protein
MVETARRPRSPVAEPPPVALSLMNGIVGYRLRRAQIAVFEDFASPISPPRSASSDRISFR